MLAKMSGQGGRKTSGGMELLTDRELEVFHLVGKASIRVRSRSKSTLGNDHRYYRARIKDKLQLRNAAELYSARRNGCRSRARRAGGP